jgi:hypothetical protein
MGCITSGAATLFRRVFEVSRRVTGRRKQSPDSESTIYDGSRVLGSIIVKNGVITALDANGRKLGVYASDRAAMSAVIAAARARAA